MRAQISDEIVTWSVPALVTACFLHLRQRMVLCLALSPLLLSPAVAQAASHHHHGPPPPTPSSLTLTPATQAIPSTDTSGTVIGTVSVTMSDGSSFTGTYSVSPSTFLSVIGNQQVVNRNLTVANAGTDTFTVTASENNGSVTAQATITVTAPPPPPTLTLSFSPQMPSIPADTPLGTAIAMVTAAWSDGSVFTGSLMFSAPYADDGGTFALSCMACATANLIVSPTGLGLAGDGGTTQNVTVVATQ
jgi:hypothetical protein